MKPDKWTLLSMGFAAGVFFALTVRTVMGA